MQYRNIIYINGYIGRKDIVVDGCVITKGMTAQEFGWCVQSATSYIKQYENDKQIKLPLQIKIQSEGGVASESWNFVEIINQAKKEVSVQIKGYGVIASAASNIFLSGDVRQMDVSASIMFHNTNHSQKETDKGINDLCEAYNKITYKLLEQKTLMTKLEIDEILEKEKFLNAVQSFNYGICNQITAETFNENVIDNVKANEILQSIEMTETKTKNINKPKNFKTMELHEMRTLLAEQNALLKTEVLQSVQAIVDKEKKDPEQDTKKENPEITQLDTMVKTLGELTTKMEAIHKAFMEAHEKAVKTGNENELDKIEKDTEQKKLMEKEAEQKAEKEKAEKEKAEKEKEKDKDKKTEMEQYAEQVIEQCVTSSVIKVTEVDKVKMLRDMAKLGLGKDSIDNYVNTITQLAGKEKELSTKEKSKIDTHTSEVVKGYNNRII